MRRIASILLPIALPALLLTGCATHVGNPTDGMGGFLSSVFSWRGNTNRPLIDSPNARRVMGAEVEAAPLEPEGGNVWPGPLPPPRTMSDLQNDMSNPLPPIDALVPRASAPPPAVTPAAVSTSRPATPQAAVPRPAVAQPAVQAIPTGRVLQTPAGPATTIIGSNGVETFTLPSGRSGIVMPNANGTLTLIGPDGTTQTIPAPR